MTQLANIQPKARENSNMAKALEIFVTESGKDSDQSLRQRCTARFQDELGQKEVTAATYFNLCVKKIEAAQAEADQKVLESKRKHKYSAVRTENASSDVAAKVHYFLSKKAAQEFANNMNYSGVVKGIVTPGQVANL